MNERKYTDEEIAEFTKEALAKLRDPEFCENLAQRIKRGQANIRCSHKPRPLSNKLRFTPITR